MLVKRENPSNPVSGKSSINIMLETKQYINNATQMKYHPKLSKFITFVNALDLKGKSHELAWNSANYASVLFVTSLCVVAAQSPARTVLQTITKEGKLLPNYSNGYDLIKRLYAGTGSLAVGSIVRTSYAASAKEIKPVEQTHLSKLGYVFGATMGELAVTQINETYSSLQKAALIPKKFNWKTPGNAYALLSAGFAPRCLSGFINMYGLCVLTDDFAQLLPINNPELAKSMGGLLGGSIAAAASDPIAQLRELTLLQTSLRDGKLVNASSVAVTKDLLTKLQKDPKPALKQFAKNTAKRLPMKMGLTGVIFGIVSGVGEALGKEPLNAVAPELAPKQSKNPSGFFSSTKQNLSTQAVENKEKYLRV